ncbi:MAG: response regulator [Candidatus Moraniibacteriota bacterium]|nr:MAG: response regulator [Candidatus Moranbacteria bacterium]
MNPSEQRFLVADDYPDLRRLAVMALADLGYTQVETAVDGQEALEKLRAGRYDFVLTDLRMPRLDGFGLLRAIKADPALKHLPVIIMSANDPSQFADPSERLGAAGYLTKPVMGPALQKAIQKALTDRGRASG